MLKRSRVMRQSSNLTLLRGTTDGGLLQVLTGNNDPSKPIATLNHAIDMQSIGYLVAGGAALIVFNKIISQPKTK